MNQIIEYKIRVAEHTDLPSVKRVKALSWLDTYPNTELGITRELLLKLHWIQSALKQQKGTHSSTEEMGTIFVAEETRSKQIIGIASPKIINAQARVGALYVLPEYTGKGVGSRLLKHVIAFWQEKDIYAEVAHYNKAAIRFYTHHGFKLTGQQNVFHLGSVHIPVVEMEYQQNLSSIYPTITK